MARNENSFDELIREDGHRRSKSYVREGEKLETTWKFYNFDMNAYPYAKCLDGRFTHITASNCLTNY